MEVMTLRKIIVFVAFALLRVASTVGGAQPAPELGVQGPAAQKLGEHHEVSIVAVRAAREWSLAPGKPAFVEAKADEVLIVVEFAVKDVRSGKADTELKLVSSEFELEDAAGRKFGSPLATTHNAEYLIVAPLNYRIRQIPFSVPDPTVVRWVGIRGLRFNIQSITAQLKKP